MALGLTLGAGWATGATAGAQEASPADPNARAVALAIDLTRASARLGAIDREAADVTTRLAAAEAALQAAQQQLTAAQAELQSALDRLQGRAVTSYRLGGAPLDPVLDTDRLESLAVVKKYANAAAAVDNTDVERLRDQVAELTSVRDAAAAEQQSLSARAAELTTARATVAAQVQTLEASLAQLGGVPVMGTSVLTAAQIAAWFASTGARANLPAGTTIADLAQIYLDEGAAERLRGEIAFAQSIVETGSFRETRGNNYSGIGNCDSCGGKGMLFPTPTDGVRAQIQLLRSYADADSRAANLAHPPDPTLFGANPVAAATRYDNFFLKGKVPLWNQMGGGNWATDPTYAAKVLAVYGRMLAFARGNG